VTHAASTCTFHDQCMDHKWWTQVVWKWRNRINRYNPATFCALPMSGQWFQMPCHGLFMWWIFILFILVELFKLSYHTLLLHCPRLCCQTFLWLFVFFIHVGGIVDNHFLSHLYLIKKTWCRFKSVDHENEVKIMWHMLDWHTQGDTRLFGNGQTPNNINLT
jgi:hypothetical protein